MLIDQLVGWLANSPLSAAIGAHMWVTPAVQTVHILAIAVILAAILMTNLRALGAVGRTETMASFSHHYASWIVVALLVLAVSGSILIIGEPKRSLQNPIFVLKMCLLALALILTVAIHAPLRSDQNFWSKGRRTLLLRSLATVSLGVWACIIFAGRWIAYAIV